MNDIAPFVIDDSSRPRITVRGPSGERFLQGFCTADVTKLESDGTCEAFFPTQKGRVLAYGVVAKDESGFEIALSATDGRPLLEHLHKYAAIEAVEVALSAGSPCFLELSTANAATPDGARRWPFAGGRLVEWRTERPSTAGLDAWDTFRIRHGIPLVGQDLTEKNIVQEAARTAWAVSFEKGCYLGQEPIARLDAMGHTNRELRVLELDAGAVPRPGDAVVFEGAAVGEVTSVAVTEAGTFALALLRTAANEPGTVVHVAGGDATVRAPT